MSRRIQLQLQRSLLVLLATLFLMSYIYMSSHHIDVAVHIAPPRGLKDREDVVKSPHNYSFAEIQALAPKDERVLEYLRCNHLHPPSTKGYALTKTSLNSPSDFREELWDIFKDKDNGFFIECGANDGEFLSNTLDLELRQNWSGLLVEAHPAMREKLLQKRRRAWVSDVCLSPDQSISEIEFMADPEHTGDSPHWRQGGGKLNMRGSSKFRIAGQVSFGKVKCFPLTSLLAALGVTHVDFLSLDVEGVELKILKTLPYDDRLTVEFIMAEFRCAPEGKAGIIRFMESKGYSVILEKEFDLIFKLLHNNVTSLHHIA